jgi:hypothetical protein
VALTSMTISSLNATSTLAGLQDLLAFPFRQPRWQEKLLLAALFTLVGFAIPLLPTFVVMGYFAEVARRAIADGELHLPEWTAWDRLLLAGLRQFGIGLIFTLPSLAVMFLAFGLMFGTSVFAGILDTAGEEAILRFMWLALPASLGGVVLLGVAFLVALVTGVALPPAAMHVIATGDFLAGFRYREWWPILRANAAGFVWAYLLVVGTSFVLSFILQVLYLTVVLCCLIPFVLMGVSVYTSLLYHAAFGLAYRAGIEKHSSIPGPSL